MTGSNGATRRGIAAWLAAAALFCVFAQPALAAGAILVGGPSSGSRLLQALADEYLKIARGAEVVVADPPLGSSAAIRAVRDGKLHLAVSTRRLHGDEL
ncbi:MAG TPA: hypothetical protein VLC55_11075, partial [Burkholderiales bacterium]|nr:hypothetical protein [Burkholderiales bacterium]